MDRTLSRQSAQHISQVALFAALLAVLGLIPKIDLPFGVPITAQTLGIMLAGCLLGPWRGFQAVLLFVVAAALGLPVLSGGRGGLAPFMSPSAGYLYGFAPAAFVTGWMMLVLPHARTAGRLAANAFIASMAGGLVFLHLTGIIGLTIFADMTFDKAFLADMAFVPGDTIKALLCALIVHTVARALPDWPFPGSESRTAHR